MVVSMRFSKALWEDKDKKNKIIQYGQHTKLSKTFAVSTDGTRA
jgi:hypothetical protein